MKMLAGLLPQWLARKRIHYREPPVRGRISLAVFRRDLLLDAAP